MRLIDVPRIEGAANRVAAAFEVEHTISIYFGIVRLLDALGQGLSWSPRMPGSKTRANSWPGQHSRA